MQGQSLKLAAVAVASLLSANLVMSSPAEARKRCVYMAHNPSGHMMADGWAKARKLSRACKRARRRCNRELKRKRRRGKAGRGGCVKIRNLSD